ncbi:hypothetical protein NL676_007162 [Syzygium grande]|nr:hypothetical protein NL676_007162 [Syzygium grande]
MCMRRQGKHQERCNKTSTPKRTYGLDWKATSSMQGSASDVADGVLGSAAVSWLIRFELDDGRQLCTRKMPCGRWKLLVIEELVDMARLCKDWTSQAKNHCFASLLWVLVSFVC